MPKKYPLLKAAKKLVREAVKEDIKDKTFSVEVGSHWYAVRLVDMHRSGVVSIRKPKRKA